MPIMLAHGGGQTKRAWRQVSATLAAHGFRPIALDLRGQPPMFGRPRSRLAGAATRLRATGCPALQREAHFGSQRMVRIARVHIGERLIAEEAAKPEAIAPPAGKDDEMPFTMEDDFSRDLRRAHKIGEPQRGKAVGSRFGDRDMRAGLRLPEGGCVGGEVFGVKGERPTPIVGRGRSAVPRAAGQAPHEPCDSRGDRRGSGGGTPARNRRDHMFRIAAEDRSQGGCEQRRYGP